MDIEHSSSRPAKRPRLKGPDGFQATKSSSKPACKPLPNFMSSFDAKSPTKDLRDKREMSKNLARGCSLRGCPQISFSAELPDFGDTSVGREANGKEKSLSVCIADHRDLLEKPTTTTNNADSERSRRLSIVERPNIAPSKLALLHHPVTLNQKPPSAPLRPRKPPSFVVSTPINASSSTKPSSFLVLKPPPLPQSPTKAIILKPLAPPTLAPSFLKKPSMNMRAISSFATDPTKDGAGAELLSLFLQQHGHSFISPLEREMQRGIGLSPRKNKGAKEKFKRGGLAERAHHLISCSTTGHILWHRQLEQTLSSASLGALLPSFDMRFRILRVLHLPTKMSTPTGVHLAVCRISSRNKLASAGDLTDQCYAVLFPHLVEPSGNFEEGKDVLAWKPWFRVIIAGVVPREVLETISVEPLMPPRSVVIAPRWHIMQAD